MAGARHWARQAFNNQNDDEGYGPGSGSQSWWWTPVSSSTSYLLHTILTHAQAGMATRYAIVALLFFFVFAFFVGGYYHAQRRLRNGKEPLAYHRWMVRRRQTYYPPQPRYGWPQDPNAPAYGPTYGPSYGMEGYPPPPPAYNNAEVPPPVYQPPQGASKAMADQNFGQTNRAGESSSGGVAEPAATARQ